MQERASPTGSTTDQALILVEPGSLALVQTSRRVQEELGYSSDRLRALCLTDIVVDPTPEALRKLLVPVENDGGTEIAIAALLRRQGDGSIPADLLLLPLGHQERPMLGAIVQFTDTSIDPKVRPSDLAVRPHLGPEDARFVEFAARLGHDFNNLLSTVIGSLGLIREDGLGNAGDETHQPIDDALSASRECADLVGRLMAAVGKQFLRPRRVAINSIIERLIELLKQTLPDNIDLQVSLNPALPTVNVDPDRLETAIIALVVNAREAMPSGGRLAIKSGIGKVSGARPALESDRQTVQITVSDAGPGIPGELLDRVLEPLFTTKTGGTSLGMGLSVVNGFVQQSHGALSIDSEPGHGTRITMNFPPAD